MKATAQPWPRYRVRVSHPVSRTFSRERIEATEHAARKRAYQANRRGYEVVVTFEDDGARPGALRSLQVLYLAPPPIVPPWGTR